MKDPWRLVLGTCPCGKRRYPTERIAQSAMRAERKARKGRGSRPRWVYQCTRCRGWHMTSQSRTVQRRWAEYLGKAS